MKDLDMLVGCFVSIIEGKHNGKEGKVVYVDELLRIYVDVGESNKIVLTLNQIKITKVYA